MQFASVEQITIMIHMWHEVRTSRYVMKCEPTHLLPRLGTDLMSPRQEWWATLFSIHDELGAYLLNGTY
jgi:hypothetical protein